MRKDVSTLIRWRKECGLPVHRIPGGKRSGVFAYKSEIDDWLKGKRPATGVLDSTSSEAVDGPLPSNPPAGSPVDSPGSRTIAAETGPWGHSAAVVSDDTRAAPTSGTEPLQVPTPVIPSASPAVVRRGWHSAPWIALAVCLISLLSYILWPRSEPRVLGFVQLTNDGHKKSLGQPLLTDGARVYFWEDRGGGFGQASVPIDGGETAEVQLPPGFLATDVSKNGSVMTPPRAGRKASLYSRPQVNRSIG